MTVIERFRHFRMSRWWSLLFRPLLFLLISLLVARIIVSLVGSVDWSAVWSALGQLSWAEAPALLALVVVRQLFNSVPLAVFIPRLGLGRGFQNDLTANLVGTLSPPPSDVVVRVAMFRSWGLAPLDAMPGVTLNSLVFYVIRFGVPVLGVTFLIEQELSTSQVWSAVISFVVAVAIVVALVMVARGERFARLLGRKAAAVVARFKTGVDADVWAESVSGFRATMSRRLVRGLPPSLLSLLAMVLVDGGIVLLTLRLMGVDAGLLPVLVVLGSFLVAYPLTALPLAGFGVLDAALVVAYTEVAGLAYEPEIVAGLVLWRVATLVVPLLLGAGTFLWWRWRTPSDRGLDAGAVLAEDGQP